MNSPVLQFIRPRLPVVVETDASYHSCGAIVLQELPSAVSVEIRTDCRAVSGIMKHKPNPMIARWLTLFLALDVKMVFLNGDENTFADLLSRQVFAADDGGPKAPAPNVPPAPVETVEKNLLRYRDAEKYVTPAGECHQQLFTPRMEKRSQLT